MLMFDDMENFNPKLGSLKKVTTLLPGPEAKYFWIINSSEYANVENPGSTKVNGNL